MRVVTVDPRHPDGAVLREAAALLRAGRLVVFPTETVYGVGANALDEAAVERIFTAKGRPATNPVIVHVADVAAARALASAWTPLADTLARAYWPGPLTLVVRKADVVPANVTAGQDTVGLRVPAHPIALALLRTAGVPVAAPSANLSTQVSPTTAAHVRGGIGERVDLVIDGGPTTVGIESTVVDATGSVPRVLRPGMIAAEDLARVAGRAELAVSAPGVPRSPGQMQRHYAPRARVTLFDASDRARGLAEARDVAAAGSAVGAMVFAPLPFAVRNPVTMPDEPHAYAQALYATLHTLDDAGCDLILIERPPETDAWQAINDRLRRASHP